MRTPAALAAALCCALAACTLTPRFERPALEIPQQWRDDAPRTSGLQPGAAPFWEAFASEDLNRREATALEHNFDLQASLHRVEQARALRAVAAAPLLPALDASGGMSRDYQDSGDTSRWQGLASLSYELDLFGKNRSQAQSAQQRLRASEYDREALRLVVAADTALAYARALALNERLGIAGRNLASTEEILRIIEVRYAAGGVSELEVSQQRVAVNQLRAARAALVEQRSTALSSLAILLGEAPQDLEPPSAALSSLRVPEVDLTPPASLLADRRPDLRSAEAGLRAAHADIGAARAAFFPSLKLGTDANVAAGSLNPAALALSLASNALAPLFSGGRLSGNLQAVSARQRELAAQYQKSVLTAFQEVEDALAAHSSSAERAALSRESVEQARNAYRIARVRFDAGSIDYPTLLETQRSLAQAEDEGVSANLAQIESVVELHRALGS